MKLILLLAGLVPIAATWRCVELQTKTLREGVVWTTQNCTVSETEDPRLTVNTISVDMTRTDIRVVPAAADATAQLQKLNEIAASVNPKFIAGINGGYFWRVDMDGTWRDNVCRGKTRTEAETPADYATNPNFGVGDGRSKHVKIVR